MTLVLLLSCLDEALGGLPGAVEGRVFTGWSGGEQVLPPPPVLASGVEAGM